MKEKLDKDLLFWLFLHFKSSKMPVMQMNDQSLVCLAKHNI